MGSRIVATVVLLAGAALLVWVAVGRGQSDSASASPTASAVSETAAPEPGDAGEPGEAAVEADPEIAAETDTPAPAPTATPEPTIEEPENFGPRMDLVNLDGWLNTDATSIDDFNGQVVLVEMWTFGCHNCKARIPYNQSYYEEFRGQDFQIVGVHAPEFSYEADIDNIKNALVDLGVTWPIALDTDKKNFRAWQPGSRNFWPRSYVIDQNGDIRYDHIGEGRYEELRETIRYLIENPPPPRAST